MAWFMVRAGAMSKQRQAPAALRGNDALRGNTALPRLPSKPSPVSGSSVITLAVQKEELPIADELKGRRITIAVSEAEYFALQRAKATMNGKPVKLPPSVVARIYVQEGLAADQQKGKR
jgi:hypothetical protein